MWKWLVYGRTVLARTFREYSWMRDALFGVVVNLATLLLSVSAHLISKTDWTKNAKLLIFVIVAPYVVAILFHILWKIGTSIAHLHWESQDQIAQLRSRLASQVAVTNLQPGDPVIEPMYFEGRRSIERFVSLELKNKGKAIAYSVRIAPLKLTNRTVYFPHISDSIHPTDFEHFYADVGIQWGIDSEQDLIKAMSEEWASYSDCDTRREILIPARVDFEDDRGIRFECNFTLLYHGGRGYNQPPDFKCIECRELSYRRIPTGITPP